MNKIIARTEMKKMGNKPVLSIQVIKENERTNDETFKR
jgi:hypothetical protein